MVSEEVTTPANATAPVQSGWPLTTRRRFTILGIGIASYGVARLLNLFPSVVEAVYATFLGPLVSRPLSLITGLVPISFAEWLYLAYGIWLTTVAVRGARDVRTSVRTFGNASLGAMTRLARDAGVGLVIFHVLWGFNYSRAPLEQRLDWAAFEQVDLAELVRVCEEIVAANNAAYVAIHSADDAGQPTVATTTPAELRQALQQGWERATAHLGLPGHMAKHYGDDKRLLSSPIYARLGITGFYFPFTAEANLRKGLPVLSEPVTMAHEMAHQRGIGPESEASFLAYVVGVLTPDPFVRYAATNYALRRLLPVLSRADRDAYAEVFGQILPGVHRDMEHLAEYFAQFEGPGIALGRTVNDQFLRANRVRGGVLNYGYSVQLLLAYAREFDGVLVPTP